MFRAFFYRITGIQLIFCTGYASKVVAKKLKKTLEHKNVYNIVHLDSILIETVCPAIDKKVANIYKVVE